MKSIWKRIWKAVAEYGGVTALVGVAIALLIGLATAIYIGIHQTADWVNGMESPLERGLVCVAIAIVIHAFFGKSTTVAKVNGKAK